MAWSQANSQERIEGFLRTVPKNQVSVRTLDEGYLIERRAIVQERVSRGAPREQLISDLSRNTAILVDGVHVYVQLLDFSAAMLEQERETEASHRRVLGMLHLHYAACDEIAEEFEAQRVDFHGPRMHAVIVSPPGPGGAGDRARTALRFADALKRTIERTGDRVADGRFKTRVRIGLDSGLAVAVNSGTSDEREPLFLGDPANYAAKLAEGDDEGIYPSNKVRSEASLVPLFNVNARMLEAERASKLHVEGLSGGVFGADTVELEDRAPEDRVERAAEAASLRFKHETADAAAFAFHRHQPPLKTIKFAKLMPSNSIRMELVSIFADIDRFTAYVAGCIAGSRISEMVTNLHVIRSELAAALRDDFEGRKVRFIGDCIHGLLAVGADETKKSETVELAVKASAGLRSSFELCQQNLENVGSLGLAIGVEFGTTPISRIGVRGDRSVRCSVSKAVTSSEELQSVCDGDETALGPRALSLAPTAIGRLFTSDGKASGLDVDALESHLASPITVTSGASSAVAAPYRDDADRTA